MRIQLHNLGKMFAARWVFRGLSYTFESSQSYLILGPNGSGKSTLLSLMTGFTEATEGEVRYFRQVGSYVPSPQQFALSAPYLDIPQQLTVRESLRLAGIAKPARLQAVLEEIGLLDAASEATLSVIVRHAAASHASYGLL